MLPWDLLGAGETAGAFRLLENTLLNINVIKRLTVRAFSFTIFCVLFKELRCGLFCIISRLWVVNVV